MLAAPSSAIDLPLKILVWEDKQGKAWVSYNSPRYLQKRHGFPENWCKTSRSGDVGRKGRVILSVAAKQHAAATANLHRPCSDTRRFRRADRSVPHVQSLRKETVAPQASEEKTQNACGRSFPSIGPRQFASR